MRTRTTKGSCRRYNLQVDLHKAAIGVVELLAGLGLARLPPTVLISNLKALLEYSWHAAIMEKKGFLTP